MKLSPKKIYRKFKAIRQAKQQMDQIEFASKFNQAQKDELISLYRFFFPEKMGTWPERLLLYCLGAMQPREACVVEVGSWVGVSTCYLAAGLRSGTDGTIHAVDTFQGTTINLESQPNWKKSVDKMGGSTLPRFKSNLEQFGLEPIVKIHCQDSLVAAQAWPEPNIDLLFIDGDHVYEAVREDIKHWLPYLKPGGIAAFHDYDDRHPGVQKAINEMLEWLGEHASVVMQADTIVAIRVNHQPPR